jgi:subtilase family serine protease
MAMRTLSVRRGAAAALFCLSAAVLALMLTAPGALAAGPLASAARIGPAPAGQKISLVLPLKADVAGLERLATGVSTPGSPQYGQYESVAALSRRFGASASARTRVLDYLHGLGGSGGSGVSGARIDATGLFADATMPVALAQRAFGTPLATFKTGRATRFVAPSAAPRIPAALAGAVTGVVGLDTRPLFAQPAARSEGVPWSHPRASAADTGDGFVSGYITRSGTAKGCSGATSGPGFTPNQYLSAYGYSALQSAGLAGQGERVALIEIDGFQYSDLRAFSKCFGLATPAINGFGVGLKHPLSPGGESTLDVEVLDAAAPGLKAVDVYETHSSAGYVLHALTAPLQNPGRKPDVISASLGSCEAATLEGIGVAGVRSVEGSLALAAASGISVLASSGDSGSSSCTDRSGEPIPQLAVSFPASSPWVTAVGGTNFALSAQNTIVGQVVWNDSPDAVVSGGGGVSGLFTRPSYQSGLAAAKRRVVPDVSMLADPYPGYEIYCSIKTVCVKSPHDDVWTQVGGTSASAPLLAGGLALVDQQLRKVGRQNVGLANPLLYKIARLPAHAGVFSDVVDGDDDLGLSLNGKALGCCSAHLGFDYASGLGSVNLPGLATAAGQLVPRLVSVGLSLPAQSPVRRHQVQARVTCSGRCLLGAYARITVGASKRATTLYSDVYTLKRKGAKTVKIALAGKTLSRLRTAVRHGSRVVATVYGAIVDPSGNVERRTRGQALRIRS